MKCDKKTMLLYAVTDRAWVGKREPHIYMEAAKRFGALPEETAVYEDALHAIETAKKANFYVVAVYDKESEKDWSHICETADQTIHFEKEQTI